MTYFNAYLKINLPKNVLNGPRFAPKTNTFFPDFINFLKDLTTQDSDGLNGTYSVEKINGQLQIHVQAKTGSANSVKYIYNIESAGSSNLILSYTISGQTVKQYFSNKK